MKNNTTAWFIAGFLVLVVAGVIIAGAMSGGSASSGTSTDPNFVATTAPAITASDWSRGPQNAPISLIEYGDFQCPACGQYYPIVEKLLSDYNGKIFFVFRNFPLYTVHPNAGISAQAAGAAGVQGKFWDMYNTLYKDQNDWANIGTSAVVKNNFDGYAAAIGLNVAKFDSDINSSAVTGKISADVTGANSASVDHTPTFFINLKQIPNPASYDEFKTAIDQALAAASSTSSAK